MFTGPINAAKEMRAIADRQAEAELFAERKRQKAIELDIAMMELKLRAEA